MGIKISSAFDLMSGRPLESKTVKADITARDAISATLRYDGLRVYVVATGKNYQLIGGITNGNWVEMAAAVPISNILQWSANAYKPYTSLTTGSFYSGSTTPSGTTRLNYGGYLYATKLYSGSTEVSLAGHTHGGIYEPVLGNPSVTGYVLASTTSGTRSWVALPEVSVFAPSSDLLQWTSNAYKPYTVSTTGKFDSSVTTPAGTTRLNYDGYLYATRLYGTQVYDGGTRVSVVGHTHTGLSTTLQGAYDNSISPEIITDSTRGAFSIRRGSAADSDDVLEVLNYAEEQVFKVTGEGDVETTGNMTTVDVYATNVYATGEVESHYVSDSRLKTNIKPFTALDIVDKLNPVTFNWNGKAKSLNKAKRNNIQYGLIAQELEEVLPELIHEIYSQYKAIDYISLIPILLQSIKELKLEVEQLKFKS